MNKIIYFSLLIIAIFNADYSFSQIKSDYKCVYSFEIMKDTIAKSYFRKETYIVQIGKDITKGYSYRFNYSDSLKTYDSKEYNRQFSELMDQVRVSIKKNIHPGELFANSKFGKGSFENYVYKKYDKNKILVIENIFGEHFTYDDELLPQQWEICSDTTTILGYKSQKAVCHFRGRDFVAWFAPEIPLSEGPWKFYGLPGLITKLHDTNNHYSFELIGFSKSNEDIDVRTRKNATKVSRLEFLKGDASGEFFEKLNKEAAITTGIPATGGGAKKSYANIELDYK